MKSASDQARGKPRVLVLGYIVRGPMGGMAWHHLQYLLGLRRLGYDAWFLEDSGDTEYCCYDPTRNVTDANPGYGLRFAADCFARIGEPDRWAYHDAHTATWHGPASGKIRQIISRTDILINLSCSHMARPWFDDIPVRVLVDTDPLFTQIRNLTNPARRALAEKHNRFFTFATNIGRADCDIPDDGFPWQPTRQPVVLDAWQPTEPPDGGAFTTVMQWDSYQPVFHDGREYGMKSRVFPEYVRLPERCHGRFEIALGGPAVPREMLRQNGWSIHDPCQVAASPWDYQDFIRCSLGEFTVAKHDYVASRSGWFSERSAAYLASGRPVVTQQTGFTDWLPAGAGLLSYDTPDEARAACDEVFQHYKAHAAAAREIAEDHFDSRKVLTRLMDEAYSEVRIKKTEPPQSHGPHHRERNHDPLPDGRHEPVASHLARRLPSPGA